MLIKFGNYINIFVKRFEAETIRVVIESSELVQKIKENIEKITGLSSQKQKLLLRKDELHDSNTISFYNPYQLSTLVLILVSCHKVHVKLPTGKIVTIDTFSGNFVKNILEEVKTIGGINQENVKLLYDWHILENSKTLEDYYLYDESHLDMIFEFKCQIKTFDGKISTINVNSLESIFDIKVKLELTLNISKYRQIILFKGEPLNDLKSLFSYGIYSESTFFVIEDIDKVIQIIVTSSITEQFLIKSDKENSIKDIKILIEQSRGFLYPKQRLFYQGVELEDHNSLIDYNIGDSKITLLNLKIKKTIIIFIQYNSEKIISLEVSLKETIKSVIEKVMEKVEIIGDKLILSYIGKELNDERSLQDYGIHNESTLICFSRFKLKK